MKYDIDKSVAFRLKDQPISGQIRFGTIIDIVEPHYVVETGAGDLIQVTENEVVTVMDPGIG
jgi:hypothetical protein